MKMKEKNILAGERLKYSRIKANKTLEQIGTLCGVHKTTVMRWEKGEIERIGLPTIQLLANYYSVDAAWLSGLNVPERENLGIETIRGIKIPVLGYVRAGIPIEAVEDILDYEEISLDMASKGEYFALSIKGDSMEPKISEGDVVIVRKQDIVENGELAVVLVNGNDATVKKFYMNENGVSLISTNSAYDPFYYTKEQVDTLPVRVIGKVVELRAKF